MTAFLFVAGAGWPLLLLLPLLLALGTWCSQRARQRHRQLLGPREAVLAGRRVHTSVRAAAAVLAACCSAVALLQPAWGQGDGEPAAPEVVVCLDVSRSMAARDLLPSRFAAAQRQLGELVEAAAGTRLGLVVFAGEARLVVPLTTDGAAVALLAATLAPGAVGRGGTDLGAAIDTAAQALQRVHATSGSIVVLSDGEDFAGNGVAAAARAQAAGLSVHCLGCGSEGGSKIVVELAGDEHFLQDAAGDDVVTHLDHRGLAAIAAAGGGSYLTASTGDTLLRLHDEELAPRAVAAAVAGGSRAPAHRYQWFLFAALVFWMLRAVLPERRR